MISTLLGLFSRSSIFDNPSFWFTLVGIVGVIIVVYLCFKYPNLGKPVIFTAFGIMVLAIDIYCVIQLNIYYTAEGGIHGYLTGIFETNKVEVVDTLTFKVDNIELLETTEGVYSASITTDEVLSLDTRANLGVFINGVPCDTTSEVHTDYAIANYPYSFYDQDKDLVCTDTLILNFAFCNNSTYLSLTTKGGTLPVEDCVKYWHHYFNKNGFEVKIAPFNNVSTDISYSNGDISNYAVINYYVNDEFYLSDCVPKGETITLVSLELNEFLGWYTQENSLVYESIVLNENINLYAKLADETTPRYNVTFDVRGKTSTCVFYEGQELTSPEVNVTGLKFVGWTYDKTYPYGVNLSNYDLTEDTTFYAIFRKTYEVNETIRYSVDEIINGVSVDLDDYADLSAPLINYGTYVRYRIDFLFGKVYQEDDINLVATYNGTIENSLSVINSHNKLGNTLKLELDSNNVLHINKDSSFEPASDALNFYLQLDTITVYLF